MFKRSNLSLLLALIVVAFVLSLSAMARQKSDQPCSISPATDSKIFADIMGKIKASSRLRPQIPHIVVVVENGVVKLNGWADSESDYDAVIDIVRGTECVRFYNPHRFYEPMPGLDIPPDAPVRPGNTGLCAAGTFRCRDVCIPDGDTCIVVSDTVFPGSKE